MMTVIAGLISSTYAQAQEAPAQPTERVTIDQNKNGASTVTVTGFRSSLALSAGEKRDNLGLTDTVFSEDIGKFPDPNIADALSRVPGVQVTRASIDGEGLNISIRGMGAAFTRVLLNGAPMASASAGHWGGVISANREVDMDFLPSELFRSATVYKSQQASVIEGGIAGTVNMRSVRPFDKAGLRSAFTLSGNYRDQHGQWGNTGSGLVSNTWNTRNWGKFGALAGVAWGATSYKTSGFQTVEMRNFTLKTGASGQPLQILPSENPNNTGGGHQSTPDRVPAGLALDALPAFARTILQGATNQMIDRNMLLALNPGANIKQIDNALMGRLGRHLQYEGKRKRVGGTISLQWQPNQDLDFYLDTIAAEKSNKMVYEAMNAGTRANIPIPIGMEFDRSDCTYGCTLTKATLANTFWSLEYRPMEEETKFHSINPGFEWRPTDKLTIDGHYNKTKSTFWRDMPTVLLATPSASTVIYYDNTTPGRTPTYTSNVDFNDPKNFGWYQGGQNLSGVRMSLYERTNTTEGARLNLTWGDSDFNIKIGGNWDDIERRYLDFELASGWANVVCSNNINVRFLPPNTMARNPVCDGRNAPGPMTDAATAYPGYGTKYTAGQTTPLAYLGSVVPNAKVPEYARASDHGFITLDWPKFAKDTDYQYFRDNIHYGFGNTPGGYIREDVTSGYVEVTGRTKILFGKTLRYNLGMRYSDTAQTIGVPTKVLDPRNSSTQATDNGGRYPDTMRWDYESTKYQNVLPSATLAYNLMPNMIARLAGSKSLTRANPADLRQTRLTINDQSVRQGELTNPKLKPFEAMNLDFGLEYYFTREAYVAGSVFAKDITSRPGFEFTTYTLAQLDALYGNGSMLGLTDAQMQSVIASGGRDRHLVEVRSPVNIDTKLKVRGLEFTWQQPLDMLPVKGFGFTANFTYAEQEDEGSNAPIAGVPPRTHNITLYYERNGLSARVSRQYSAAHPVNTNTGIVNVPGGAYSYTTERAQYDASVGMNLKRLFNFRYNTDVTLSVWNANKAISRTYTQFENAIFDEYKPGASYTLSLRTSF
jgi:TonB-dependent receptor